MKLQHPKTGDILSVPEEHGKMLLRQGFYKRASEEEEVVKPKATRKKKKKSNT